MGTSGPRPVADTACAGQTWPGVPQRDRAEVRDQRVGPLLGAAAGHRADHASGCPAHGAGQETGGPHGPPRAAAHGPGYRLPARLLLLAAAQVPGDVHRVVGAGVCRGAPGAGHGPRDRVLPRDAGQALVRQAAGAR